MQQPFNPVRLLAEIILIVGLGEALVMLILPFVAPGLSGLAEGLMNVALLVLVSTPALYWRCVTLLRRPASMPKGPLRDSRQFSLRAAISITAIAQVGGLLATGSVVLWLKHDFDQQAQTLFDRGVERIEAEVKRRFNHPLLGLQGARGVYAASRNITRQEFRAYVQARDLSDAFPGVRGFGFVARVQRSDLEHFIAAARQDFAPEFDVRTQGSGADLWLVKFIEPLADNRDVVGTDMGSDPVRREAAERAMNAASPALSGKVAIQRNGKALPGVLYFLPVYRNGNDPQTVAQRQAALVGLLYAPMVASDLLSGLAATTDHTLRIELFDGPEGQTDALLFDSDRETPATHGAQSASSVDQQSWSAVRTVHVGGRTLDVRVSSTPVFNALQDRSAMALATITGALASLLAALTVWLLSVGRLRAQRLAERMTMDLDRLARVVQHTGNAVIIADTQMRILWVNEGFTRVTGYSAVQAMGKTPGELLGSGKTDPETIRKLQAGVERGVACRVEVLNRTKDGREYWSDIEVQPTRDADGVLTGFMEIGTDVTALKETQKSLEAAIRASSAMLSTVQMHTIVTVADRDGKIIEVNDAFCAVCGYSREELIGQNHRIVNSGVQPVQFWLDMWANISHGASWRGDICNRAKNGSLYWVDSMIAPFIGDDGLVEKYVSMQTDITARKHNERRLAEVTDRMTLAIEGGSDCLWDWMDVHQDTQWWAPNYYTVLGYTPEEVPPRASSYMALLHPDSREPSMKAGRDALDGLRPFDIEVQLLTKSQGYRWFRTRAKVYFDDQGRALRMAGATQDIHDRKLAQDALKESEAFLDRAGRIAGVGGWRVELKTAKIHWSKETRRLHEVDDSYEPQLDQMINFYAPEARPVIARAVRAGAEQGIGWDLELPFITAKGRALWVRALGEVEFEDGKPAMLVGAFQDITERRNNDAALRDAVTRAEQASVSKSQFVANMSHEIRTPMNAILGMLKLLQNTDLTARQLDYTAKTEGAARSLLGLLNDILDYSKVEAGKMTLDPRAFRVDQLMRDLSVILSASVGDRHIEVLFDIDPAVPQYLVGDDMRLQQVLINLGGNAIKFTSDGEVVVSLRVIEQSAQDVLIEFAVKDSGIGIAPENQGHIFSGFSQAEASTTRRFGGTGLGLAISSRLVTLLGGTLAVDSVLGQGSSFHFQIRIAKGRAPLTETPTPPTPVLGALRALIVDDNDVTREVLRRMVEPMGWQVDVAASGLAAIACIEARAANAQPPYEAIFMDWQMPDMDGWQTSQRIRGLTASGAAPIVIMVTAHGREMLSQRSPAETAMINGFLVKPVTAPMLLDAVVDAKSAALAAAKGEDPTAPMAPATLKRLQGLRLLVVEDNKINQLVAKGLLTQEGANVTLADNGQLGVDAVMRAAPPFDAVLMDVQMPVMDGYAATQVIRQTLGLRMLPIIAMTANAMASDRAACLAAGMNDHVGKPFELDHLVALLLRLTNPTGARRDQAPDATGARAAPEALRGELDVAAALERLGGDASLYATVVHAFAKDLAQVPTQVTGHLKDGDAIAAARVLHTLKGLAAMAGNRDLSSMAARMESQLTAGLAASDQAGFTDELRRTVDGALATLDPVLRQFPITAPVLSQPAGCTMDKMQLLRDVRELGALLAASDMFALSVHARIAQTHGSVAVPGLGALDKAMTMLDFGLAAQLCQGILQDLNA